MGIFSRRDKDGYDRKGYNPQGFNKEGNDEFGFNLEGIHNITGTIRDESGFDEWGKDAEGFGRDGYTSNGIARDGYDKDGYDENGYDSNGYDKDGYDLDGYDKEAYDKRVPGFDRDGVHKVTGIRFDENGYDRYGYDKKGYDKKGYDKDGYDKDGLDENGYEKGGIAGYQERNMRGPRCDFGELKLSHFVSTGDSRSLSCLDDRKFTIINVERKDYDENKGIKITTKEDFDIEGEKVNKFHTTRQAIVGKFLNYAGEPTRLFNAINQPDNALKVKIFMKKSASGRDYYDLEQC